MQKNNIDDKLFDAVLKIAAEEALRKDMEEMPSCEELNAQYKPSFELNKKIGKIISQHNRKEKAFIWKKNAMKVAVSVIVVIFISGTVLLSVDATRNYIFNAIIKWQEDHFSLEHDDNVLSSTEIYRPKYLPEGFNEISSNVIGEVVIRIIYQNEAGTEIIFKQYPSQSFNMLADNEDKEYTTIKINGQETYFFEATKFDKNNIAIWESNGTIFNIASEVKISELILIAESIKK